LIDPASNLTQLLIAEHHDTSVGGLSGYEKTLQRLKKIVYWKGLKSSIRAYVRNCDICRRSKQENVHPAGLFQPLPIPDHVWESISMDLIEGQTKSLGKTIIFVVVDRLTKLAHFMSLSHPFTARQW